MSAHRPLLALGTLAACGLVLGTAVAPRAAAGAATRRVSSEQALAAFDTVKAVLQNPRCQNCHIPGDAPLQLDEGQEHLQNVKRGPDGSGAPGLPCSTCHASVNPPASYGAHMPPGAPSWKLPPPERKMVFINLSKADLCATLKDPKRNGGRDAAALLEHVSHDKLVLWGWDPGVGRSPVRIPHAEFVRSVQTWIDGGMPCPATSVASALPGRAR